MSIENEGVFLFVENEVWIEQENKVLESAKQVEIRLGRLKRIGNRIQAGWKGEAGELCYERLYEMIQQIDRAREQIEEYARKVQSLVEKKE